MGLFCKETECPNCRKVVSKKDIIRFDPTQQDKSKRLKEERICRDCAMEKFYEALLDFNQPLALVEPIKSEAYVRCDIDGLLKMKGQDSESSINFAKGFLSTFSEEGTKCNRCNKDAKYSWCASSAVFDDPYRWEFNYDAKYEHLCPECTVKAFKEALKQKNIEIKEAIVPPIKGRMFMFGWGF